MLLCSKMFTNTGALQREAKEGFSAQFYSPLQQKAGAQAELPARGAAPRAPQGSAMCPEVHRCCSLPVCSSGLGLGLFWNEALSEPPAALRICHGKAGKSLRRAWQEPRATLAPSVVQRGTTAQNPELLCPGRRWSWQKYVSARCGVDLKSLTHPSSHPVWHKLETVSEMDLSVLSYNNPRRSCRCWSGRGRPRVHFSSCHRFPFAAMSEPLTSQYQVP